MTNTALTVSNRDNWLVLQEEADNALRSGYLPAHIKNAQQAVTIAMVGRELGITTWRALTGIKVIQGTPTLSSELMAQLIYQAHGGKALSVEESTDHSCTISYQRKDGGARKSYTYTMAMAERAGLATNANYKKHPENMLRARCISNIARMAFPDTIAGCYTEDEISPEGAQDDADDCNGARNVTPEPARTTVIEEKPAAPTPVVESAPPKDPNRPAPKAWLDRIAADQQTLQALTGSVPRSLDGLTAAQAEDLGKQVVKALIEEEGNNATQADWDAVLALGGKLLERTGVTTEIPDALTRGEARELIKSLKEQIAAAHAAQEPEPELAGV